MHVAVGLGLRDVHVEALLALADRSALDLLEVMIDDALDDGPRRATWRRLGAKWPLVAHGTELGIAGDAPPAATYLGRVGAALSALSVSWYSEHLAFVRAGDCELGHFVPPFDDAEALAALSRNAAQVRAAFAGPFLLENAADVLGLGGEGPGAGAARGRAYGRALAAADAGALLDLTNLVLDARNDGFEPGAYLAAAPLDRVVEVHLAGGRHDGHTWIDSHDHDVDTEALELLIEVAKKAPFLRAVIVERDERVPDLAVLLAELDRVRAALARAGAGMTDLTKRHAVLARFLDDPAFEGAVRADPAAVATAEHLDLALVKRLASLRPERVRAFRASRAHKDALRQKMADGGVSK